MPSSKSSPMLMTYRKSSTWVAGAKALRGNKCPKYVGRFCKPAGRFAKPAYMYRVLINARSLRAVRSRQRLGDVFYYTVGAQMLVEILDRGGVRFFFGVAGEVVAGAFDSQQSDFGARGLQPLFHALGLLARHQIVLRAADQEKRRPIAPDERVRA